jgi:hypothetical protein
MRWILQGKFQAQARDFLLIQNIQTGSGTHQTFFSMDTESYFLGDNMAGA